MSFIAAGRFGAMSRRRAASLFPVQTFSRSCICVVLQHLDGGGHGDSAAAAQSGEAEGLAALFHGSMPLLAKKCKL